METTAPYRPFEIIMIQPTSFCNIQCDYCYLDVINRGKNNRTSLETIEKICERVFTSSLIESARDITFMWHEGEPLMMPISYYKSAIQIIQKFSLSVPHTKIQHSILTNATLINKEWCSFFHDYDISVGVSVDGPAIIHDKHRITRKGKGTFDQVAKGISMLKDNGILPYVLTTIHDETLKHASELFKFYKDFGIKKVGFNFEEVIGQHTSSTIQDKFDDVKSFVGEFFTLYKNDGSLFVREFDNMRSIICENIELDSKILDTVAPYAILTINHKGDFSTFAPELIDMKSQRYGDFIFGNVYSDSIEETIVSEKFSLVHNEILEGIQQCRISCEYFDVCGSNLPAHKVSEHGTFNSSETSYCRAAIKAVAETLITDMTNDLNTETV